MLETLTKSLAALGADGWELTENKTRRWEFYFIRHALDQNRAADTVNYNVKVYKKLEGGLLGSASCEINPTDTASEVEKKLADLLSRASLVKNPAYSLVSEKITLPDKTERVDVQKIARDFIEAVASVPETETEDINSYEIFVSEITRHTLNSNGVEYTAIYPASMLEIVVNARREGHEIELYRQFNSGSCDKEKVRADVLAAMRTGRDRLAAEPTPRVENIDVVLSTEDAVNVFEYFTMNANVQAKYRRISPFEQGKPVCDWQGGDKITVRAVRELDNSSRNFPVDAEGSVIEERDIIKDGVLCNFWGQRQFSQYLGIEKNSVISNFVFDGGSMGADELRSGDYIELVEFSDFQVDSMGGDVAGEIRLGYLHKDCETKIITGGSVSGSMIEAAPTMKYSRETAQYNNIVIPAVVRLKNLRITGVK